LFQATSQGKRKYIIVGYTYEQVAHMLASCVLERLYEPLLKIAGMKDPFEEAIERDRQGRLLRLDFENWKWERGVF
jgi:hypothetical protein